MTLITSHRDPQPSACGARQMRHITGCGDLNALPSQGATGSELHLISAMQGGWPGVSRTLLCKMLHIPVFQCQAMFLVRCLPNKLWGKAVHRPPLSNVGHSSFLPSIVFTIKYEAKWTLLNLPGEYLCWIKYPVSM